MTQQQVSPSQVLRITEIYKSIQGESSFAGLPCVFIRLTGCPLRCRWCDTAYGFQGGDELTIDQILAEVRALGVSLVELTGGEPLSQHGTNDLARRLCDEGFTVLIETSGSEAIEALPNEVHIIMDLKCPGSGMVERNRMDNLKYLKSTDEIKFVIADLTDFEWATQMIKEHELDNKFRCLLSPAFGLIKPDQLVNWMLEAKVTARLNLQIHKYIWNPRKKGV